MKLNFCTNIIVFFKLYFIIVFNNYIKLDSKIQKYQLNKILQFK